MMGSGHMGFLDNKPNQDFLSFIIQFSFMEIRICFEYVWSLHQDLLQTPDNGPRGDTYHIILSITNVTLIL